MTQGWFEHRERIRKEKDKRRAKLASLAFEFAEHLAAAPKAQFKNVNLLPDSKSEIICSFLFCIANAKTKNEIEMLSAALMTLSAYQALGEQQSCSLPNPENYDVNSDVEFIKLTQDVKKFQEESILLLPKIQQDKVFFEHWINKAIGVNENFWPFYRRWRAKWENPYRKIPAEFIDFPVDENGKF